MFQEQTFRDFLDNFDPPKHKKVTQTYIQSFDNYIKKIDDALRERDTNTIKTITHDVKSIGYMTGAHEMGEIAEAVESLIMKGDADQALTRTPDLLASMIAFIKVITVYSKNHL